MAYNLILDPKASSDIVESMDWYNNLAQGLGLKFYKQIQAVFKIIQKNPLSFAKRYKNVQTATVKKFPFMVHYFINAEIKTVVVIAVLHSSRDSKVWFERSK